MLRGVSGKKYNWLLLIPALVVLAFHHAAGSMANPGIGCFPTKLSYRTAAVLSLMERFERPHLGGSFRADQVGKQYYQLRLFGLSRARLGG